MQKNNIFSAETNRMKVSDKMQTIKHAAIDAKSSLIPRLVVAGKSKSLNNKIVSIGRSKTNQVIISDPKVSKFHATIYFDNGVCYIQDNDSTNGTYVNGNQILSGRKVKLKNGDKIKMGQTTLDFYF